MKIVINKQKLDMAVKNICRVINSKNALPVLGDIHFNCYTDNTAQNGTPVHYVEVTGSDSEVWLRYYLTPENLEGDGEFCVDATMLKNALANLPVQLLEIIVNPVGEYANMAINHQTGHTIIPVESADEYPQPLQIDENNLPTLCSDVSILKRAMKRSLYALADDPLRPQMGCLYFDKKEEQLNIVASNGHVLIKNVERADEIKDQQPVSFMMPKKVANTLLTIMGDLENDDCLYFAVDERQVKMDCDSQFMLQFRTPEGKYPNYDSVIPSEQPYFARGDRQAMIQAIKNVSPFANNSSNMVVMRLYHNKDTESFVLEFMGDDYDFSTHATDRIQVATCYPADSQINIGMKASSLIDSVGRLVEHEVEIQFADPMRAVTIRPLNPIIKDEEVTMLIMPMIINEPD